jgi:ATP/maltotriose-dependent transcriptional regulator MalT
MSIIQTLNVSSNQSRFESTHIHLLGQFHIGVGTYYLYCQQNISVATNFLHIALSLAISTGNTKQQFGAMYHFAWIKWLLADHSAALQHICEAQKLARMSADLYKEGCALRTEAVCWMSVGNYEKSMCLCNKARNLLGSCGMSSGTMDQCAMITQAMVQVCKSEYSEARNICAQIHGEASADQDVLIHGWASLIIAEIKMYTGAPREDVQRNIDMAKFPDKFLRI